MSNIVLSFTSFIAHMFKQLDIELNILIDVYHLIATSTLSISHLVCIMSGFVSIRIVNDMESQISN